MKSLRYSLWESATCDMTIKSCMGTSCFGWVLSLLMNTLTHICLKAMSYLNSFRHAIRSRCYSWSKLLIRYSFN